MATWEDGPEYAPLERPDAFAQPSAAFVELEAPPPPPSQPEPPGERPVFADPDQPVPPLAALAPEPPAQRDPGQPFEVVSSVMTAESSAWASAHWPPPQAAPNPATAPGTSSYPPPGGAFSQPSPYPSTAPRPPVPNGLNTNGLNTNGQNSNGLGRNGQAPNGQRFAGSPSTPPPQYPTGYPQTTAMPGAPTYPSPVGGSFPPPSGPASFPPPSQPPGNGPFPAPGTPQWFVPGGYQQPAPPPVAPNARAVLAAATPGVLVTLVVGGFVWVLAPVTVVVAFLLSSRMTYGRRATRVAFASVLSFLGLVGLLSLVTADGLFAEWWNSVAGWSCFGCWVMVVVAVIAAYRALKLGQPDPPPTPRAFPR